MYAGYPIELVPLLRCPVDAAELEAITRTPTSHLKNAVLRCRKCSNRYPVEDGIVRFLSASALDAKSEHERTLRDRQSVLYDLASEESEQQQMEIVPTLEALRPLAGGDLLEIGCGTGRYTVRLAPLARITVAIDFSVSSLYTLATRLNPDWIVGLVHADATQINVAPMSFDRALSTLVSNLPTAKHRQRMMVNVARGLRKDGRFVFSTHYYDLRSRIRGMARSGYYRRGGIYRYLFERSEIVRETGPYFQEIACRPIQIALPLAARLRLPMVSLSRIAERIPLVRMLGELLLVTANRRL